LPSDTCKPEVKGFIKMLLYKKVTRRCCAFNALKTCELFAEFNFDDLLDFKLKAPYIPETYDWSKQLSVKTHQYETLIYVSLFNNLE
jgi:hypothetical protein